MQGGRRGFEEDLQKKDSASAGRKPLLTRRNPDDVQES
jgi:hypothetical protein